MHSDPSFVYHPSVQINNDLSLGWEPKTGAGHKDVGVIKIWRAVWDGPNPWRAAKHVCYWEKANIFQALHASIDLLHEKWEYDLWKFNCEHWARGMVTGEFKCLQLENAVGRVFNWLGMCGINNNEAQALIVKTIRKSTSGFHK